MYCTGEFGEVCRGRMFDTPLEAVQYRAHMQVAHQQAGGGGRVWPGGRPAALKTLRGDLPEQSRREFLAEAVRMAPLRHSNIVQLLGVVVALDAGEQRAGGSYVLPSMIATEFMSFGALDTFLK